MHLHTPADLGVNDPFGRSPDKPSLCVSKSMPSCEWLIVIGIQIPSIAGSACAVSPPKRLNTSTQRAPDLSLCLSVSPSLSGTLAGAAKLAQHQQQVTHMDNTIKRCVSPPNVASPPYCARMINRSLTSRLQTSTCDLSEASLLTSRDSWCGDDCLGADHSRPRHRKGRPERQLLLANDDFPLTPLIRERGGPK